MRGGKDPIGVIEAAYRLDVDEDAWLVGLVEAVRSTLDQGRGVYAWCTDMSRPMVSARFRATDDCAHLVERFRRIAEATPTLVRSAHAEHPVFVTFSQLRGRRYVREHPALEPLRDAGFVDGVVTVVLDPESHGAVAFGVPLARVESAPRAMAARWSCVSAHLGLALRARRRHHRAGIAATQDAARGADAVLSPGGRVEHAEREAREPSSLDALRTAARAVDRARGKLRRNDPDEAVEVWRGLVSGRWSLVDHCESDGRRYLVARRNDPTVAGLPALDARDRSVVAYRAQGHSLKLIAYELGVSIATVSASLARARALLGLRDEEFARAFAVPPPPPDGY